MPLDDLAVRRLADRYEPRFRDTIYKVVAALALGPELAAVEKAIEDGDLAEVMRLWTTHITGSTITSLDIVSSMLEEAVLAAGKTVIRVIPAIISTSDTFATISGALQRMSENALSWITHHSTYLVTGLNADAHQSVRTILEAGYRQGMGAPWTARQMREVVGLLPAHAAAVARYAANLRDRGFPAEIINRNTATYARRLLKYRTENIARTETITAASAGQLAGWQANIASGLLDPHRTWVEWMVTEDDRLCPLCAPMDGQRVRVGEFFTSDHRGFPGGQPVAQGPGSRRLARRGPLKPDPYGAPRDAKGRFTRIKKRTEPLTPLRNSVRVPYPPLHPSCRCALVLRFDP